MIGGAIGAYAAALAVNLQNQMRMQREHLERMRKESEDRE